jgi:outer membrane immunogenic protein
MSSRFINLALAGIALVYPLSVSAADLRYKEYPQPYDQAPQSPLFSWQGAYLGAHGSFVRRQHDGDSDNNIDLVGGLQVGYNHVIVGSSLSSVFGAELEGDYLGRSDAEDRAAGIPDQRWLASAKLRYGLVFDRTLLFVTGGFATTRLTTYENGIDKDKWKPGYLLGAGAEYALTDKVSLKAEYNYVRFGDWQGTSMPGFIEKSDLTNHIAKAGLNYHF